jgi:hypothetical protein
MAAGMGTVHATWNPKGAAGWSDEPLNGWGIEGGSFVAN